MAKKGVSKISGNPTPTIGEKTTYIVADWYPATPAAERNPAAVTWELFKKRNDGSFTTTNIKKVGDGSFTFGDVAAKNTYRIEAYLHQPEGKGLTTMDVTPQPAGIPKINKVDLRYVDDTPGTVFSYTEKLVAKAQCINLTGKKLLFTLWEDDAAGEGHHANNKFLESREAVVDRTGTATAEFVLTKALMQKASQGERDPKELEFYVTVEYYKDKKHASENREVKNPDYKAPTTPAKPAPAPNTTAPATAPKSPAKAEGSPASQKPQSKKEEKGIMDKAAEWWDELWDYAESKGIVKPDKKPTPQKPEGKTVSVVKDQDAGSIDCGEKYCIKKGDKNELVREINIRLAGFGGNVPTDEFTDRTEKMIKQFQRDYMKVPETGKVCGNVLRAIDEFSRNFDISASLWNQLKCSCSTKGKKARSKLRGIEELNNCDGFGDGTGKNTYKNDVKNEAYHKYEYPGIHRSLLFGFKALQFYFSKQTTYKIDSFSSGYRCRFKNYTTTNHQGKAMDIQFSKGTWAIRNAVKKNLVELRKIRDHIFIKYLGAQKEWPDPNLYSIEPIDLLYTPKGALRYDHTFSWIHMDVRKFDAVYLDDKYFCKNLTALNGKPIIDVAIESGFTNTCKCYKKFESQAAKPSAASSESCEDKFKKVAPIILEHEGGYKNEPSKDKGDPTNRGISWPVWQKYAKEDLGVEPTEENQKKLTEAQATIIYKKRYWEPKGYCEVENLKVALMVYDWSITSGGAIKEVQKLLVNEFDQTITIDGGMGKDTAKALNAPEDQEKLLKRISEIRKAYYDHGAEQGWFSQDYLKGLKARVDKCMNYSL